MIATDEQLKTKAEQLGGVVTLVKSENILDIWEFEGLNCAMLKGIGGGNGYVQLPKEFHGKRLLDDDLAEQDIQVHGGLTYGMDEAGWVGFDTAHAWDVWMDPDIGDFEFDLVRTTLKLTSFPLDSYTKIWTLEKLRTEVEYLATQVKDWLSKYEGFESNVSMVEHQTLQRAKMDQYRAAIESGLSLREAIEQEFKGEQEDGEGK